MDLLLSPYFVAPVAAAAYAASKVDYTVVSTSYVKPLQGAFVAAGVVGGYEWSKLKHHNKGFNHDPAKEEPPAMLRGKH